MPYIPIENFRDENDDCGSELVRDFPALRSEYALQVFPETLTFTGDIDVKSPAQTILIKNNGFIDLIINDIIVVGPFSLETQKPVKILVGKTVSLEIAYTGKSVGTVTGGVYVYTEVAIGKAFIHLTGSVTE